MVISNDDALMTPMYIICFYWEGERWQSQPDLSGSMDPQYRRMLQRAGACSTELASTYVNNLYHGVCRHTDVPFDFICFTNEPLDLCDGIIKRKFPLVTNRGVLPRIFMFSGDAGLFGRQVLCLDLDVVIVGNLDPLTKYRGLFCARSKFKRGEEDKLDGDIMSFRADEETESIFWEPFKANVNAAVSRTQGRERYWIRYCANDIADRWDRVSPGAVLSYKRHLGPTKKIPEGTSIVSCHGFPRPHQINGVLYKHWNDGGKAT